MEPYMGFAIGGWVQILKCSQRLETNYLRLTVEEIRAFEVFTNKILELWGCSGSNVTATVNCTNPKAEATSESIETKTIKMQV